MAFLPEAYKIVEATNTAGQLCGCCVVDSEDGSLKRAHADHSCLCPVHHEDEDCKIGVRETVEAIKQVHSGRVIMECPMWSVLRETGKHQGRDSKGNYRKGYDFKMDLVIERELGAIRSNIWHDVVGIEVDGPGHHSTNAKGRDKRKNRTAPFRMHRVTVADMHDEADWLAEAEKAVSSWQ